MRLITILLLIATSAFAGDIRVIGKLSVDLGPLKKWLAKPEGERPLNHWREVSFRRLTPIPGSQQPLIEVVIDGETRTIVLRNVTPSVLTDLTSAYKIMGDCKRRMQLIEAENLRIRNVSARLPSYASSDTPEGRALRQLKIDQANLETDMENLKELQNQYDEIEARIQKARSLAMNTGTTYAKCEVWDCGIER